MIAGKSEGLRAMINELKEIIKKYQVQYPDICAELTELIPQEKEKPDEIIQKYIQLVADKYERTILAADSRFVFDEDDISEQLKRKRVTKIIEIKHALMYVLYKANRWTLATIGNCFYKSTSPHTNICFAVKRAEDRIYCKNYEFMGMIDTIKELTGL